MRRLHRRRSDWWIGTRSLTGLLVWNRNKTLVTRSYVTMATTFASFGFTVLTKHSVWRNLLPIKRTKLVYIPATSRTRPLNPVDDSRHINSTMNTEATHHCVQKINRTDHSPYTVTKSKIQFQIESNLSETFFC